MEMSRLCDLRRAREVLGKSQTELSALLGVSTRAVQSYEQGWRPCPPYVQKLVGMLLMLHWRRAQKKSVAPCWKIHQCTKQSRSECPTYQYDCPDMCWLVTGDYCHGEKQKNWQSKLAKCMECEVMQRWMPSGDGPKARTDATGSACKGQG